MNAQNKHNTDAMGCCGDRPGKEIFRKERRCTDCLILLPFLAFLGAMGAVASVSIVGGDPDRFIYPSDYLGQFCGKPGSVVADRPYGFFPELDSDIKAQLPTLLAGRLWDFKPFTLCVSSCPAKFSLVSPEAYGGAGYPGAGATDPEHYNLFETVELAKRCFPTVDVSEGTTRDLCAVPDCKNSELNATLHGTLVCTSGATPTLQSAARQSGPRRTHRHAAGDEGAPGLPHSWLTAPPRLLRQWLRSPAPRRGRSARRARARRCARCSGRSASSPSRSSTRRPSSPTSLTSRARVRAPRPSPAPPEPLPT